MIYVLWGFAGWCGTPYPRKWPFTGPPPPPPPDPWYAVKLVSIIGGLIGGYLAQRVIGTDAGATGLLTTMVCAFAGGGFLGGVVGLVSGGRGANVAAR